MNLEKIPIKAFEILEKKNLIPLKNLSDKTKTTRFTVLLCKDRSNKKLVFKFSDSKDKSIVNFFKREIFISNYIYRYSKTKDISLSFDIPEYTQYNIKKKPFWLMHTYAEGSPLGIIFDYNRDFLTEKTADLISNSIIEIQKMQITEDIAASIDTHNSEWYNRQRQENISYLENILKKEEIDQINVLFEELPDFTGVPAHQDLDLSNIIFNSKNNKIVIIDWELFSLENPARDPAYIWVHAWKNPEWRKYFLTKFISNSKNKKITSFFKTTAILEAMYCIKCSDKGIKPKIKREMQKYYNQKSLNAHINDIKLILNNQFL